ncbi:MAG: LTA synthase family protein [Bacillota bacterium]|nr:LTA synthase family protein [Bacillota bacterium]
MMQEIRTKVVSKTRTRVEVIDKLWIYSAAIIMLKSMLFLATLHTPNSAGIDTSTMYFTSPPISVHVMFIVLIMSFSFLFKSKGRFIYNLITNLFVSILLLGDLWYYRAYGSFMSIQFILEPKLFNTMNRSLIQFHPIDLLFLVDILVMIIIKFKKPSTKKVKRNIGLFGLTFFISSMYIGIAHYLIDDKDITKGNLMLFRTCWASFQTMSNLSPLGYHGYDIYREFTENKRIVLSNDDKQKIDNWFEDNKEALPDNDFKGMFKGKNLIVIQVESLENFVIGQKVYGQEITPNLNKLLGNSLYFDNIYEQNNNGTSTDADLLVNTSLFPVREEMTFFRYPLTEYNSLPVLLSNKGYNTISAHAALGGNYNWSEVHRASLKFQTTLDIRSFNIDETIRDYLTDGSMFRQLEPKLNSMKQPFYSYIVTQTSHGPFDMPKEYQSLKLPEDVEGTYIGDYFQSINYTDKQIGLLLEKLKNDGILQNSVVMIYGDHTGVHKYYNDQIQGINIPGDWWKTPDYKIPLIMYNPSVQGKKIETIGGHIDIMPTIAYLLGVDEKNFNSTAMGKILVKTNKNFTVLNSGEIVGTPSSEKDKEHMLQGIPISDEIIRGNYFKK